MNFINNLNIRSKLSLLFILLLIPLVYLIKKNISERLATEKEITEIYTRVQYSERLFALLNELQKERGLAIAYFASGESSFLNELNAQKNKVDSLLAKLKNVKHKKGRLKPQSIGGSIADARSMASKENTNIDVVYNQYSVLIKNIIKEISIIRSDVQDPELKVAFDSYLDLVYASDYLGEIREAVTPFYSDKTLSIKDYGRFSMKRNSFEIFLKAFYSESSNSTLQYFFKTQNRDNFKKILSLIEEVHETAKVNESTSDLRTWHGTLSAGIEDFNRIESFIMATIKKSIQQKLKTTRQTELVNILFVLCALAVSIAICIYIIRIISKSIISLKNAADRLAQGDTGISLHIKSKDEIGELSSSMQLLSTHITHLSQVAQDIGKGNYDRDIDVQGPHDILGNALTEMRINLKQLSLKETKRNWILAGSASLSDIFSREKSIEGLSSQVLKHLSEYINGHAGILYLVSDTRHLYKTSSFGYTNLQDLPHFYKVGEGLIGEAVFKKEPYVIQQVPQDYYKIHSEGGIDLPKNIMLCPLQYENLPVGVVEIASQHAFDETDLEYVSVVAQRIAMVFIKLKSDIKTQELLWETQKQAEELEHRQIELGQINDQLRAQRTKLQTSEEELKVNQQKLREKNNELNEKANQLEDQYEAITIKNKELEEAREAVQLKVEQLQTVDKYKTDFLANMSHELRTPLNSVLILAKLISDNKTGNLTEKQVEFANIIHKSGTELLRLIDDILDLSKIESGKLSFEITRVDLKDINMDLYFRELSLEKKIKFTTIWGDGLPEAINTDKFRLDQILKNLISNAFKFTQKDGQICLKIQSVNRKVRFNSDSLKEAKNVVSFSIIDNGIGISEEKQKIIFEAFRQGDSSISRKYGGTGLGLSISRELALMLGGEIKLESLEDRGSTFTLYLPADLPQTKTKGLSLQESLMEPLPIKKEPKETFIKKELPKKALHTYLKRKKVLLVDDDIRNIYSLYNILEGYGMKVISAGDGKEALEKVDCNSDIDIVLMDVMMPVLNGLEATKQLREHPKHKYLPIIMVSAKAMTSDINEGLAAGADDYLSKPLDIDKLLSTMEKCLREKLQNDN
ncbi:MAG TPA: response regulator [Cytophagaceae bacterium]|jgi:signal transduction histidine kinase/CheY-like chemotaxis protein/HAMP domain-containing protein